MAVWLFLYLVPVCFCLLPFFPSAAYPPFLKEISTNDDPQNPHILLSLHTCATCGCELIGWCSVGARVSLNFPISFFQFERIIDEFLDSTSGQDLAHCCYRLFDSDLFLNNTLSITTSIIERAIQVNIPLLFFFSWWFTSGFLLKKKERERKTKPGCMSEQCLQCDLLSSPTPWEQSGGQCGISKQMREGT